MVTVILGYTCAALNIFQFWRTNKTVWLAVAILQLVLSGLLLYVIGRNS